MIKVEREFGSLSLSFETGRVAKQANGSVLVRHADTVVLVAVVASREPDLDRGYFPLFVDYREKTYAAGKIPGGFFKREGRPRDKEIISARLVDRSVRPLFPEGFKNEIQVMATVLSSDQEHTADVLAITGASVALSISDIPFMGPIAGVRVGFIDNEYIINPTFSQLETSSLDLVVVGTADSIIMVEGSAKEVSEETLLKAVQFAQENIKDLVDLQQEFIAKCPEEKMTMSETDEDEDLRRRVIEIAASDISKANRIVEKVARADLIQKIIDETVSELIDAYPDHEKKIIALIHEIEKNDVRQAILKEGHRLDGRGLTDIRQINCELGVLPRTHGSALFTRGQTQSLSVATLGTKSDEQLIDDMEQETTYKKFMLHYNFPSFSVGEVRPIRGPGRREIGHGFLAERSIEAVIPSIDDDFPYTIRLVSEILESNGSSSMATVCGASLALMDAGVPIKKAVAGIAMGLIKEGDEVAILSDILGAEDHLGDMDFKVAGTREGITGFQMDIKITGISFNIMESALLQAHEGRCHILNIMDQTISRARENLSPYAPRITKIMIEPAKIGALIGPGGKIIRSIQDETGATIEVDDDGTVLISSVEEDSANAALELVKMYTIDPEEGQIYEGKVKSVVEFGAFIEILPGKEGLLHISEIENFRVERVEDYLKEGETVRVKLLRMEPNGKMSLSRKVLLEGFKAKDHDRRPRSSGRRSGSRNSRRSRD